MSQSRRRPPVFRADTAPPHASLQLPAALKADCSQCSGLCCAVHAFYAYQGFGFDKPAHTACKHLNEEQCCSIHTERKALGFAGCIGFDCYGAGQRVTQELFPGVSWRTSAQLAASMFAAYSILLVLHRLLAQVTLVAGLARPSAEDPFASRLEHLEQLCRSPAVAAGRLNTAALEQETVQFLQSQLKNMRRFAAITRASNG